MKNFCLSLLALFLLGTGAAKAETVTNYTVDFNTAINTSTHDFKVAPGWRHAVDYSTYSKYVTYTYSADQGVNGSGALIAGTQTFETWDDYEDVYDLLVTPAITGSFTIKVKKTADDGTIDFYTVITDYSGAYKKNSVISVTVPTLSTTDFTTITVTPTSGERVGIRASQMIIDDFSATSVNLELERKLSITKITRESTDQVNFKDCDENNNFTINYPAVTIKNTGDVTLKTTDSDYKIKMFQYTYTADNDTLPNEWPIAQDLDPDSTYTFPFTATLNGSQYPQRARYDLVEMVTNTSLMGAWYEPSPYVPEFEMQDSTTGSVVTDAEALDMGVKKSAVTRVFRIINDGAAPLNITTLTVSGDFTTTDKAPINIAKHDTAYLHITMPATSVGKKTGNLKIASADSVYYNGPITGEILAADALLIDFEDGEIPLGCIYDPAGWTVSNYPYQCYNNPTNIYSADNNSSTETLLITPLLEVKSGDVLQFDAATYNATLGSLNVYYSADRKNWIPIRQLRISGATNPEDTLPTKTIGLSWYGRYEFGTYTSTAIPAGQWYLAFGAGGAHLDNITGYKIVPVQHDVVFYNVDVPETGMVNYAIEMTDTLMNLTANTEAAGTYTVKMYVDGEEVASQDGVEIAGNNGKAGYSFSYTPHATGTYNVYFKAVGDNFTAVSDTFQVVVTEETIVSGKQFGEVGSQTSSWTGTKTPVALYYYNSETECVYTPAQVGLPAGTKITRLTYRGTNSGGKNYDLTLKVWMQNTTDTTCSTSTVTSTDNMTQVYNGTYALPGGSGSTATDDLLVIDLAQPFVYDGGSLRISMSHSAQTWNKVIFQQDESTTQAIARSSDQSIDGASWATDRLPVVYVNFESSADSVSGTVTDKETAAAIEGANVTLVKGDVEYYATSDAQGAYKVAVMQAGTYTVITTAEGYKADTTTVTTGSGNITLNIKLEREAAMVYVIKAIEGENWNLTTGELMNDTIVDTDAQFVLGLLNFTLPAVNGSTGYLGFTTKLASANDAWSEIAKYRLGPVSETVNFDATDYMNIEYDPAETANVKYIAMDAVDNFVAMAGGNYDLYIEITPATVSDQSLDIKANTKRLVIVDLNPTGVSEMPAELKIADVKYYNLNGVQLAEPTTGINIRVITYENGTTKSQKILK